jgi:hypothetical protein
MQSDLNQTQNTIQLPNSSSSNADQKSQPLQRAINNGNRQSSSVAEESDEDPLLKEGYLPEIYFSLKSDNPADW